MKLIEEITKAFKSDCRLIFSPKCPKCGGPLIDDKCDAYSHGYGFYKVWTCSKCGEEWTNGSGI